MERSATQAAFAPTKLSQLFDHLDRLPQILAGLSRRKAFSVSFAAGCLSSLALPPAFVFPILWLTFPLVALQILQANTRARAFWHGWWFGFGMLLMSLYWISSALTVASDALWWMLPFAAVGLPAALAIFPAIAALIATIFKSGPARVFLFAAGWLGMEFARGMLFTGFPWNLIGHSWAGHETLLQSASYAGIYGMSGLVLISACLPTLCVAIGTNWQPSYRQRGLCLLLALMIPIAVGVQGNQRLTSAPGVGIADLPNVGLRLVQANIPQREKWPLAFRGRNFERHVALSTEDRPDWVTTVIWPETAAAFFLEEDERARKFIGQSLPEGGHLITGAPRRTQDPLQLFNSVIAIDATGATVGTYDKGHLVPFGEYVPFRGLLNFAKVTEGGVDYSPGPGPSTMTLSGLPPFSPLVCYEVIFPSAVIAPSNVVGDVARPGWLLNLTNDAWYGETAGPHQHLTMARLRAVEEGIPLVRATNTGITVAFDSYGRELGRLGLNEAGYLDLRLPRALDTTFYATWPFAVALLCLVALIASAVWSERRTSKR